MVVVAAGTSRGEANTLLASVFWHDFVGDKGTIVLMRSTTAWMRRARSFSESTSLSLVLEVDATIFFACFCSSTRSFTASIITRAVSRSCCAKDAMRGCCCDVEAKGDAWEYAWCFCRELVVATRQVIVDFCPK